MAQIKNRFDIENFINNGDLGNKKLPNFFEDNSDGVGVFSSLALSVIFHIAFVLLLIFFSIFCK